MGNARASICGSGNLYSIPRFLYLYVLQTIILFLTFHCLGTLAVHFHNLFFMKKYFALLLVLSLLCTDGMAQRRRKFDYSQVFVPEEGGTKFEKITEDADAVYTTVGRSTALFSSGKVSRVDWWVNPQIAISPDGTRIAYLSLKNDASNVMVKNTTKGGVSVQRTFRTNVRDVSWSPDGQTLCFTEWRNGHNGIYLTGAEQGSVVKQISGGSDNDFGAVIARDGKTIYFHRGEGGYQNYSLWSYNMDNNLFSNYSRGMTPQPIPNTPNTLYCARFTQENECEIWRINYETGVEEVILAQPGKSFTSPQLSPNGRWILCTGSSVSEKEKISNTDIYVVRTDGTGLTQLTFHPGNDLSAVWSADGKSIFFLSQRGSAKRLYNVWKMEFKLTY